MSYWSRSISAKSGLPKRSRPTRRQPIAGRDW
jgi:hypothetical protein